MIDAFIKIYMANLTKTEKMGSFQFLTRLKRFYVGMSLYGLTFITFIAIEFSLYEVLLRGFEQYTGKETSLVHKFA